MIDKEKIMKRLKKENIDVLNESRMIIKKHSLKDSIFLTTCALIIYNYMQTSTSLLVIYVIFVIFYEFKYKKLK